ncbi:hypothetical protein GCM10023079_20020 [Streptomyces chitinivorans]
MSTPPTALHGAGPGSGRRGRNPAGGPPDALSTEIAPSSRRDLRAFGVWHTDRRALARFAW